MSPIGHGTCVASKVAGPIFGVAKNANLVIVQAIPAGGRQLQASDFIAVWAVVARDIESAGLSGRAVVTASIGCEQTVYLNIGKLYLTTALVDIDSFFWNDVLSYKESIRDVINLDVPVVVTSGNIKVNPYFLLPNDIH
jgi:subtilisin family serine protease